MQSTEEKKQILVVEDEGLIAADIQQRLERLGYRVPAIVSTGEEALRRARATRYDLVLMDIRLKGEMDGIATAEALKNELATPVVYITAHADQETIRRATLTEPYGYILKPVTDGDLRSAIHISLYKHEMECRLRASEAWLSTTLRSVGEGIVATDTNGDIVFMNPAAEQFTGWSARDAHGRPLMDVLVLTFETTGERARNPIFEQRPDETPRYILLSQSGAQTAVEVACFENQSGDDLLGSIVALREIGMRKMCERRYNMAQRMEAAASLAGGMARDFDRHLERIRANAGELCARLPAGERGLAVQIEQAVGEMASLTAALSTVGGNYAFRSEVFNLNEFVREFQPQLLEALGEAGTLAVKFDSPEGFVQMDRDRLKQVLLHLAHHARGAMPADGVLRIEADVADIRIDSSGRLCRPGCYARLLVSYTADPVDFRTIWRIFEPCNTGESSSLGLSIVHSIVVHSGGHIGAAWQPGNGVTVEILLPCYGTLHGPQAEPGPTILFVEFEDSVRYEMLEALEREGYRILATNNGCDGEAIAAAYGKPIDVLISGLELVDAMDLLLPDEPLEKKLRRVNPEMKALTVAGYRHDTEGFQELLNSRICFLAKPYPPSHLVRQVRQALSGGARRIQ